MLTAVGLVYYDYDHVNVNVNVVVHVLVHAYVEPL